jgi:hypothetical protein
VAAVRARLEVVAAQAQVAAMLAARVRAARAVALVLRVRLEVPALVVVAWSVKLTR